jgi:hypothetical protein
VSSVPGIAGWRGRHQSEFRRRSLSQDDGAGSFQPFHYCAIVLRDEVRHRGMPRARTHPGCIKDVFDPDWNSMKRAAKVTAVRFIA